MASTAIFLEARTRECKPLQLDGLTFTSIADLGIGCHVPSIEFPLQELTKYLEVVLGRLAVVLFRLENDTTRTGLGRFL